MKAKSEISIHELQCTLADHVYQQYQKEMYGLTACEVDYDEGNLQEIKLLMGLKQSGITCPSTHHKLDAAGQTPKPLTITTVVAKVFVMTFVQSNPAGIWLIQHNLGYKPLVEAYDNFNNPIPGAIKYLDINSLQITFNSIIGGKAYLYQT